MLTKENTEYAKMLASVDINVFSIWLTEELNKRGWTQADLSKAAHISRASITNVLTGTRQPGPDLCNSIAKAFRLPPETVFRAAGLLPPEDKETENIRLLNYLYTQLENDQDREDILDLIRAKINRQKRDPSGKTIPKIE